MRGPSERERQGGVCGGFPHASRSGDLVPDGSELAIELRGDLFAILHFAAGKRNPDFLSEAGALDGLLSQVSLVAGARFELATFKF